MQERNRTCAVLLRAPTRRSGVGGLASTLKERREKAAQRGLALPRSWERCARGPVCRTGAGRGEREKRARSRTGERAQEGRQGEGSGEGSVRKADQSVCDRTFRVPPRTPRERRSQKRALLELLPKCRNTAIIEGRRPAPACEEQGHRGQRQEGLCDSFLVWEFLARSRPCYLLVVPRLSRLCNSTSRRPSAVKASRASHSRRHKTALNERTVWNNPSLRTPPPPYFR